MTTLLFDTLKLSRTLRDRGHFTPEQAEALAEAISEASQDNLATKTDVSDLKTEMAKMKADILKWIIGAIGLQTLAIIGVMLKLVH
jgi:hypothetical protein